jgi:hypothetical protein
MIFRYRPDTVIDNKTARAFPVGVSEMAAECYFSRIRICLRTTSGSCLSSGSAAIIPVEEISIPPFLAAAAAAAAAGQSKTRKTEILTAGILFSSRHQNSQPGHLLLGARTQLIHREGNESGLNNSQCFLRSTGRGSTDY